MDTAIIRVENLEKNFKLPHEKNSSIKSAVVNFYRHKRGYEVQRALKDISFEVQRGEFFGIVGRNGSGKSTLLKLLAGIYTPTKGSIQVNGSLTPFIELGVGFNPELTGRENVYLNGALLGFNRKEMSSMYKDIVEFAELKRFMDQKLKNYSSGMQVRLAFSIAIRAKSDILLIDEVLAVGDSAFQKKCFDHFMLLKKNKQTVILVTHDMDAVRQYCDRAIMINGGKITAFGDPEMVAQSYQKLFVDEAEEEQKKADQKVVDVREEDRWGNGRIKALRPKIRVTQEVVTLECRFKSAADLPAPVYGFTIYGPTGANILEGNTKRLHYKTDSVKRGETIELTWSMPNIFKTGRYEVSVACCDQSTTDFYDWVNGAASFEIFKEGATAGMVDPNLILERNERK